MRGGERSASLDVPVDGAWLSRQGRCHGEECGRREPTLYSQCYNVPRGLVEGESEWIVLFV